MRVADKRHLISAVKHFARKRVLVVGDLMLDLYLEGPPRSVSQEAPVIVVQTKKKYYKLGGAANAAESIHALGAKVYLAGVIGDHNQHDDYGRSFLNTIKRSGLNHDGVLIDHRRPTTLKMRVISDGQQIVRVDEETTQDIPPKVEKELISFIDKALPSIDAVLISDYAKGVVTKHLAAFVVEQARKLHIPVVVDPKPQHKDRYRGATLITPNELELSRMFGEFEGEESKVSSLTRRLKRELSVEHVLVTRGSRGMDFFFGKKSHLHIPALAQRAVDVSGAGDTVAAIMTVGVGDLTPRDLTFLSALAAKVSVSSVGTTAVTAKDLIKQLKPPS